MKRIALLGYNEVKGGHFWNGVSRAIYNQTVMLRERGYEVFFYNLFSRQEYKDLNRFLNDNAIDVAVWHMTTLKIKGRVHTPCPLICLWHSTPSAQLDVDVFRKKYGVSSLAGKILATKVGGRLLLGMKNLYTSMAFSYITACADKYVLLSNQFKSIFFPARLFPNKVKAIPNFIARHLEEVKVDCNDKKKEVLFVGRMDNASKRIDLLLRVWEIVEKKYEVNDWVLNICGSGPDLEKSQSLKEDLGLKNVFFQGFVQPEEWYQTASIFCMTSEFEGFPMVLAESEAFGCVLMAFDSFEAISDLITDKENGRLIEAFDIDAYAEALHQLMVDEKERRRMAENAMQSVKRFYADVVMDEWEKLFEEVVEKRIEKCKKA